MGMYQVMQSVKVKDETLAHAGEAGHVVADHTKLIDGVYQGIVEVKMDTDNEVYDFDVAALEAL
jgi:hypothetical protein